MIECIEKEGYFEKTFRKQEERYCAKHGRRKFLKHAPKRLVYYIIALVLVSLYTLTLLIVGVIYVRDTMIIASVIMIPMIIMINSKILPLHLRCLKKCRNEQMQEDDS